MNEVYKPWEPSPEGEEEMREWPLEFGGMQCSFVVKLLDLMRCLGIPATEEDYNQWEGKDLDDLDEMMKHVTEKAGAFGGGIALVFTHNLFLLQCFLTGQIRFGNYGQEEADTQEQITK